MQRTSFTVGGRKTVRARATAASSAVPIALAILVALSATTGVNGADTAPFRGGGVTLDVPPVTVASGERFDLVVNATTYGPIVFVGFRAATAPGHAEFLSWSPGAALRAYVEENGDPPACDIIIYPGGRRLTSVMVLDDPFESARYGTEWLIVHCRAIAPDPVRTCVLMEETEDYEPPEEEGETGDDDDDGEDDAEQSDGLFSFAEPTCIDVEITAPIEPRFVRGDANDDGRVSIADAIRVLTYLFAGQGDSVRCLDAADADDDGGVAINDPVLVLSRLFEGAGAFVVVGECGADERADDLPYCDGESC